MLATETGMLGQVLLVSLVLGAGLPVLFGLGLRAMARGAGGDAEEHPAGAAPRPRPLARLLGVLCFALAAAGVVLGITVVVASGLGYEVGLGGGPLFVEKS
ncbi:hypothetical protein MHY85_17645 [Cellulomonas sp. ACRRI]|uniref:hypothetical protein n=1 Tax=Cellulomonas sp. ACRRI TaxID=2918188 RepID=UPI001EF1CB43|nr:hypothetical protein [Cellulomonas sp. ACRRI]MCG7287792.1 hypothetical protein [Cellulomonas sp. ACRRI]